MADKLNSIASIRKALKEAGESTIKRTTTIKGLYLVKHAGKSPFWQTVSRGKSKTLKGIDALDWKGAQVAHEAMLSAIGEGKHGKPDGEPVTLSDLFNDYHSDLEKEGRRLSREARARGEVPKPRHTEKNERCRWDNHAAATLGRMLVNSLDYDEVKAALLKCADASHSQAEKLIIRVNALVDDYFAGKPGKPTIPRRMKYVLPRARWGRITENAEPRSVMLDLDQFQRLRRIMGDKGTLSGRAVLMLMLTGCRKNEVLGMRWEEIQTINGAPFWIIPQWRLKSEKEDRVIPWSAEMAAIVAPLRRSEINPNGLVFTQGGTKLADNTLNNATKRLRGEIGIDFTVHDIRRSLMPLAVKYAKTDMVIAHAMTGHKIGDKVFHTYGGDAAVRERVMSEGWPSWQEWISSWWDRVATTDAGALRAV